MLFYDKSNNLCETFRKNSDYSVSKSNFYKIKHILNNDQFKKINKIFIEMFLIMINSNIIGNI